MWMYLNWKTWSAVAGAVAGILSVIGTCILLVGIAGSLALSAARSDCFSPDHPDRRGQGCALTAELREGWEHGVRSAAPWLASAAGANVVSLLSGVTGLRRRI
jgi:hypothetical protein